MQVVYEEDNHATARLRRGRRGRNGWLSAGARRSQQRFLSGSPRRHPFKERERLRMAVNAQFKLFALKAVNETALLVQDDDIGLDQFRIDANHVRLVWSLICFLLLLSRRGCGQHQDDAK